MSTGDFSNSHFYRSIRYKVFTFGSEKVGVFGLVPNFRITSRYWPQNVIEEDSIRVASLAVDYFSGQGK